MTLKTQMATDLALFYNEDDGAVECTYTPSGADPETMVINFGYMPDDMAEAAGAAGVTAEARIQVADVSTVTIHEDTATIGSAVWLVIAAERSPDGLEWLVILQKR